MPSYYPGTCEDCGADFARVNKKRKRCTSCQILRDQDFRPGSRCECQSCGVEFFPLRLSYKTCNVCREVIQKPDLYPACKGCNRHNRPAPEKSTFCLSCVQRDPITRQKYLNAMRKRVRERADAWIEAGRPTNPPPPPKKNNPDDGQELFQ